MKSIKIRIIWPLLVPVFIILALGKGLKAGIQEFWKEFSFYACLSNFKIGFKDVYFK